MTWVEDGFVQYGIPLLGLLGLAVLLAVAYLGAVAAFREARRLAQEAGHRSGSAAWRALVRIALWIVLFLAYYVFAFAWGKRIGWWAAAPAGIGLFLVIGGLLLADRLLTARPGDVRAQGLIGATLLSLLGLFAVATALAV